MKLCKAWKFIKNNPLGVYKIRGRSKGDKVTLGRDNELRPDFGGGLDSVFVNYTKNWNEQNKLRKIHDKKEINDKELYDTSFELKFDKEQIKLVAMAMVIAFTMMAKPLVGRLMFGDQYEISRFEMICCFLLLVVFVFSIVALAVSMAKKKPRVQGNNIIYKDKTYSYTQVSAIKIGKFQTAHVYIDGKKIFAVPGDYINYGKFIAWARKCNIQVTDKQMGELSESQIAGITAVIVVAVLALVLILDFMGII